MIVLLLVVVLCSSQALESSSLRLGSMQACRAVILSSCSRAQPAHRHQGARPGWR